MMEEREAQELARRFVTMFNGSILYGCAHPATVKNAALFCGSLTENLKVQGMATFALNNKTLMIEKWPLEESPNTNTSKLTAHFEKIGLKAVSFARGVQADSIQRLLALAGDINNIETCHANIATAKPGTIPGIRINPVNSKDIKKPAVKLPQGALNTNSILFLLSREIKRHHRYGTPFSTITASIKHIIQNGEKRAPNSEELAELLPQLFNIILPLLRDVDLAGTIIHPELFLALPMTDEIGARTVKVRILEKVDRNEFTLANQRVNISARVTFTIPSETTKDIRSYIKHAMIAHYA
ncbi:MAG: hypothetical protein LBB56_02630 [Chitinispirillales bacterium]|jgi:hypothetical protein|nr:hypothetical protein [Chitinispirillales bacterium]